MTPRVRLIRVTTITGIAVYHAIRLALTLVFSLVIGKRGGIETVVGEQLTSLCEDLGPTFIKLGQLLSTRRDLLPPAVIAPLRRLQDGVTTVKPRLIRRALESEYGCIQDVFSNFEDAPIATASIAQVHRATLRSSGVDVAVKIRRPGIEQTIASDCDILHWCAVQATRIPSLKKVPLQAAMGQLTRAILGQLDFRLEGERLDLLRERLEGRFAIRVPSVYWQHSSRSILVMEFMDDLERLDEFTVERERSAAAILNTLRALYAMIFEFGVVHCDLHPGNVFLQGNSAVILDGGFTAALSPSNRAEFCDFFLGIVSNDGKRCARILRETATDVPELFDLARFESEIALLIDRNSGSVAETFQVARFVGELFDIMRRHGVRGSTAFTMAILSLLVFEGLTRIRFPDLAFQQEAVPFVVSSIVESAQIS